MDEYEIEVIEKEDGSVEAGQAKAPVPDDVDIIPIKGYLNITGKTTGRAKNQLQEVLEYARNEAGTDETASVLMVLRNLENRLRAPKVDESRLAQLHSYVKLQNAIKQAEEERNTLVR